MQVLVFFYKEIIPNNTTEKWYQDGSTKWYSYNFQVAVLAFFYKNTTPHNEKNITMFNSRHNDELISLIKMQWNHEKI